MKNFRWFIIQINLFSICCAAYSYAQTPVDSLQDILKKTSVDSIKVDILHDLAGFTYYGNPREAIGYCEEALQISIKAGLKDRASESYGWLGYLHENLGEIEIALQYYDKGLMVELTNQNHQNIGAYYNNIGTLYFHQQDFKKAIDYYLKSIEQFRLTESGHGLGSGYANCGSVYYSLGDTSKAIKYYDSCLVFNKKMNDLVGTAYSYVYLGLIEYDRQHDDKALEYFQAAIEIEETVGDLKGLADAHHRIGKIYLRKGDFSTAVKYGETGLKYARMIGYPEDIANNAELLYQCYEKQNKNGEALEMFKLQIQMRDTMNNLSVSRATIESSAKFEYAKKAAADSVVFAKEAEIQQAKIEKRDADLATNRIILIFAIGVLSLVVIFALVMVNRIRVISRQKKIIERKREETQIQNEIIRQQKNQVEEAHKEITDSINYAERIQRSLMASKTILDENLLVPLTQGRQGAGDYFIYFNPKEKVSGDFYWTTKLIDKRFCLVAADSTGHGVPGAIMSMLNIASLEKAIAEKLTASDEILNFTRAKIIQTLANDGSPEGGKDGMDAVLLIFNQYKTEVEFSMANNPLWIIRGGEIMEFKPDKMPVGRHDKQNVPFTRHLERIEQGDLIYIFTDGYADQFGGESGKKFKYSSFKELLLTIAEKSMEEQKAILAKTFDNWRGNLEQVDDVCVIGIRV